MWTLFIVSMTIGYDEPKVTRYAEFDHKESCYYAWHTVTSEFTEGETAYCKGPDE